MIDLQEWQRKALGDIAASMKQHLRVLVLAPTGSGKTVIGAALVAEREERVLWLAHRRELIDQAREALLKAGVPAGDIGIISGGRRENENARILVGSCQMHIRKDVPEVDLIVIDEAHRSAAKTYVDILAEHKGPVIGLTATPRRLDGKPLSDAFDYLVVMATIGELIELVADNEVSKKKPLVEETGSFFF